MIGARCVVELPDGTLLRGQVVAEESDVTPAGGPAWRMRLDVPVPHPLCLQPCSELCANKHRVHLES